MPYSDAVLDHTENPRNVGSLDKNDPNVGIGLEGAPACGDVSKLSIRVNPETGIIEEAVFKGFGCGSLIASMSLTTELIKGKLLEEAENIKNVEIYEALELPPIKAHCSLLAEETIKSAIADYRRKKALQQELAKNAMPIV
jgi:nitrogen fixation NifU-like protein